MLAMMGATMLVTAPLLAIGGIYMALQQDVGLSWLIAVAVPLLLVFVLLIISRMVPLFRSFQKKLDAVNRVMREQLTGVRVVRAFVREDIEEERFAVANTDIMVVGRKVGSLFVLLFPVAMLVLNVTVVGVIWFGAIQVDAGTVEIGTLFAFMAVRRPDPHGRAHGELHDDHDPARGRIGRAHRRGAGERVDADPRREPRHRVRRPRHRRVRGRGVHLSRRRVARPAGHHVPSRARRDGRDRRFDRGRQDHAHLAHPPPVRRDRRRRPRRRRRRARGRPRLPVEGHRPRAAAPVPVLRHRRLEPALRTRGGDRRRALEGARDRAGQGLRRRDGGAAERAHRAGRHQRLGRPAAAPRDRPGDRAPARRARLRRLVLGSRPLHRRAAQAGAVARAARRDQDRRRTARVDDHRCRPHRRPRGRTDGRASARTRSSWRPATPTERSSNRSWGWKHERSRHPHRGRAPRARARRAGPPDLGRLGQRQARQGRRTSARASAG